MIVIDLALLLIASLLLIPGGVYFVECAIAVSFGPGRRLDLSGRRPRLALLVPAHNEQALIAATVRHLRGQLVGEDRVIVIADNCSDDTAKEAGDAGAEVWIRADEARRGKGYAIEFAVGRLAVDPPEVVVFVDADCRLSDDAVDKLSRAAAANRRPVQALYLMAAPRDAGPLASVSTLAYLIRNLVRPLGLYRLGFPCHLTGTGMAFPWAQLERAPAQQDNLVEDLVLGLELAIAGHPPLYCGEVLVQSDLPDTGRAAKSQRRRWEHGQMATLISHGPRLISQGFRQRRPELIALAADLAVPPLALLVSLLIGIGLAGALAIGFGASTASSSIAFIALGFIAIATMASWARFARAQVPFSALALAPAYLAWKLPLYAAFFFRKRQKDWVRTERTSLKSDQDDG